MTDRVKYSTDLPDDTEVLKAKIRALEQKMAEAESVKESLAVSEAKYKTIIDNLMDVIFTNDLHGMIDYCTANVRHYGYTEEDVVGHHILEFVHPDDRQLVMDVHRRLMDGKAEVDIVVKLVVSGGSVRLMENHAKSVVDAAGKVTHMVSILRDMTDQKAAEDELARINSELEKYVWQRTVELSKAYEALRNEGKERKHVEDAKNRSEHFLSELIRFLPDPTFVIDQEGKVVVWNQAMEDLTGVKAPEMVGKGDYEYAHPFYREKRPVLIDYALDPAKSQDKKYLGITRQGDTLIAEAYTPFLKGQPCYLWGIAKPYYDSGGNIVGAIESIRDITRIRNMSFKLNNELDKFKALYDLAVNMSAEKSLEENLDFIVEKSRKLLATDAAYIALIDEGQQCLVMHTLSGIKTDAFKKMRVPLDQGVGGLILRTREGRIIDDYFNHDEFMRFEEDVVRREGLISSMAVPVFYADRGLGVLYVATRSGRKFSQSELDTLLLFGHLSAVEIVRHRADNKLKESEATYRTVFENTGTATVIIERNGILGLVNEEFSRMTGYQKEAIEGKKRWKEFVVPEDVPGLAQASKSQLTGQIGPIRQYEFRFQDRYGHQRDVSLTADIIPGISKSVAALADVTRHKRMEQDLKRAQAGLETRVEKRTRELTLANEGLKELLQKQEVNIDLAKDILAMINSQPHRHLLINDQTDLFFTALYLPCFAEGGDHFFIKNFSDRYPGVHKTALSLKDQSGHEVSCILRSIITDLVHNALLVNASDYSLEKTITQLNRAVCDLSFFGGQNFFTAINAELDHQTMKMRYVSAGHPPFLLIRGQDVVCLPPLDGLGRNIPVGILDTIDYTAGEIQLQTGDKLIFFTDGLTDMPHHQGHSVLNAGDLKEMLLPMVLESPEIPVSSLVTGLFNQINGIKNNEKIIHFQGFDDDVTVLGLELEDHLHQYEDVICPQNLDDFSADVARLYPKIKAEWQARGFSSPDKRLHAVLDEALINAWKHGNLMNPDKKIVVRRRYGNDAVLEVIDEGKGFDYESFYDPTRRENILTEYGRGNFIMRLLTEERIWTKGGNHFVAFFARHGEDLYRAKTAEGFDLWRRSKRK